MSEFDKLEKSVQCRIVVTLFRSRYDLVQSFDDLS